MQLGGGGNRCLIKYPMINACTAFVYEERNYESKLKRRAVSECILAFNDSDSGVVLLLQADVPHYW